MVPRLRSVAAEIETPGQSPRSGIASPSSDALSSGESFSRAFLHQARRLRNVVLHQKARPLHATLFCSYSGRFWQQSSEDCTSSLFSFRCCVACQGLGGNTFAAMLTETYALQVSFQDVAQNPRLAKAARAELDGHQPGPNAFAHSSEGPPSRPHDGEVCSSCLTVLI